MESLRFVLDQSEIPTHWYNVVADMAAYDRYFAGELEDFEYPAEAIKASLSHLPKFG
ncbi:MAG: hypothetical protein WAZ34_12525 [Rhodocyclaceae bacterium]